MKDGTYIQIVNPVLAVLATPKFNQQQRRQAQQRKGKKPKNFDSFFHTACDTADENLLSQETGCYGKDAKPITKNVSRFNRIL